MYQAQFIGSVCLCRHLRNFGQSDIGKALGTFELIVIWCTEGCGILTIGKNGSILAGTECKVSVQVWSLIEETLEIGMSDGPEV